MSAYVESYIRGRNAERARAEKQRRDRARAIDRRATAILAELDHAARALQRKHAKGAAGLRAFADYQLPAIPEGLTGTAATVAVARSLLELLRGAPGVGRDPVARESLRDVDSELSEVERSLVLIDQEDAA